MSKDVLSASVQESSRDRIMARIRAGRERHTEVSLPDVPMYDIKGDKVENFISKLESFDGKAVRVPTRGDALRWLAENLETDGKTVYSAVAGFKGNFEVDSTTDPHSANVVDICVANGILGVGETGSIWVTEESLGLTACALFSTDLYLLLEVDKIYSGLHQAYAALNLANGRYGAFYTGPSATADIEAVHITGAQGEISLTAILIG
ncbi:LUD domain-containing protein [uncultured Duncaniella sp.]|uniref:LutC/YkgG family protein n=1 Tax=uncultured Duncaniella sp. TaxID=2768039 RepID=UPI00261FA727|nr:LUD domain-containing protein [uncultured Duncaniella sp.]